MKRTLLTFIFAAISIQAYAGTINLQNGNYAIAFVDMKLPWSGGVLEIKRVYNSGSYHRGIFGFGFGSMLEDKLVTHSDGSVEIQNAGSGASEIFTNETYTQEQVAKIVDQIFKRLPGSAQTPEMKTKLFGDYQYRQDMAKKFSIPNTILDGARFSTLDFGLSWLIKTKEGWALQKSDKSELYFDNFGRLTLNRFNQKNALKFFYNPKGHIDKITDQNDQVLITFSFNSDGFVTKMNYLPQKWAALYKYKFHQLIHSDDSAGNQYSYQYDKNDNLIKITDGAGKTEEMQYEAKWRNRVSSHKSFDDVATAYLFTPLDAKEPLKHFKIDLSKKFIGSRAPSSNAPFKTAAYQFHFFTDNSGRDYLDVLEQTENGITTRTEYGRPHGLPTVITRDGRKTTLAYYPNGLLKTKTLPSGETVTLEYNEQHRKVSSVKTGAQHIKYEYDAKGNLIAAIDALNKTKIALQYDEQNRIVEMVDGKSNQTLNFKYNNEGRPEVIEVKGVGTLRPQYDAQGNVIDMKSSNGRKLMIQAQEIFGSLVNMVKPAGVSIGFGEGAV